MGMNDGLKRMFFFPIGVHIFVPRGNAFTVVRDTAKRIRQADRKEYALLKKLKKEFTFNPEDVVIDDKGKRILYLFTKDFIKFCPVKIDKGTSIKPVDMKKLSIYTDNIKRTYESTANTDKFAQYLPLISIIIFAVAFVIMGNFVMEQINQVAGSLGGVSASLEQVAERMATNCLQQPASPTPIN